MLRGGGGIRREPCGHMVSPADLSVGNAGIITRADIFGFPPVGADSRGFRQPGGTRDLPQRRGAVPDHFFESQTRKTRRNR